MRRIDALSARQSKRCHHWQTHKSPHKPMLWDSGRGRRRRLETPSGLVHLTKWCTTLFIILESTSVGSGLIASMPSMANFNGSSSGSSSSTTVTTQSVSTPASRPTHESTGPPKLPHFEALVQPIPRGFEGDALPEASTASDTDPLLLLGGFRFPAELHAEPIGSVRSGANPTSGSERQRTSPLVVGGNDGQLASQGPKPNLVNLGVSSSGSSKLKSVSLNLANKTASGSATVKGKSIAGSRNANVPTSEQEPGANRIDGNELVGVEGNFSKMFFETENLTMVSSQVGSIAVLPCVVRNIGAGLVSWIRRKDYHLLTIGVTTYSSDERFNIIRSEDSEEWPLQIKYVQLRDAGPYECQVSTHPPTSIFIQLDVVEAKAEIFGPSEKYLKPGSTLRLTCRVVKSNEPPLYIFWYHNNRMINYDVHRGVNVSTEADNRFSELVISHTNTLNSGNYSCVSNNAVAASTLVHILNGENPAAMQHGDHGNAVLAAAHLHLLATIVTYHVINSLLCAH
ncbi:uncharacterized protein LOC129732484 [Wyeomyia smithii]|uniref:uncharacterized protein LOC129732484 n=1 Tax=Wyeomyia smithii TaxID=174621 RepID=UPI002467E348|nr:uncharacterized protein LOC129732484 [Wyeomyia smithii]XP_055549367.1 uncharacterized protein LOC129732484 [Wyeomyia smithii]